MAEGRVEEAERLYDEAQGNLEAALGRDSPGLAGILNNKALLLAQLKRGDEAEQLFLRAINLTRTGAKTDTPAVAIALYNLAALYAATGRQAKARVASTESEAIMKRLYGDRRPPVLQVWLRV